MKQIKFNKEYYMPILTGEKTQTLRLKKKKIQQGEIIRATFPGIKFECKLRITRIGYKQFKYINEEDAKLEGYENVTELKEALKNIYPNIDKFDRLYYYRFKIIE